MFGKLNSTIKSSDTGWSSLAGGGGGGGDGVVAEQNPLCAD